MYEILLEEYDRIEKLGSAETLELATEKAEKYMYNRGKLEGSKDYDIRIQKVVENE